MTTLEDLFRLHAAEVLAYALRRTDPATAEDVVSEVFLVAGRKLDRIPATDPHLWLYGVARRVLANDRRGARRRTALTALLADVQRGGAQPPAAPDSALLRALAALRPADREVLMLSAWEGLDAPAVAAVMKCTPHAVHTRLHRARARLQAELARHDRDVTVPIAPSEVSP